MKAKKKHNWMRGFVITPKLTDIQHVEISRLARCVDMKCKSIKNARVVK